MTSLAPSSSCSSIVEVFEDASQQWGTTVPREVGEPADWMIHALRTVLGDSREAVYVSTPITTGPEFVSWWRSHGSALSPNSSDYRQGLSSLVESNLTAVRPLVAATEQTFKRPVIDPTRLGKIADWEQENYHAFWVSVLAQFVRSVVFADGWAYSTGCCLEYAASVRFGLEVLDSGFTPLTTQSAFAQIEAAKLDIESVNMNTSAQNQALDVLK